MDLKSVKAVVTGGASGLGRATVMRIIAAGGRAAILDLASSAGADAAKPLGGRASFAPADVTNGPAVEAGIVIAIAGGAGAGAAREAATVAATPVAVVEDAEEGRTRKLT